VDLIDKRGQRLRLRRLEAEALIDPVTRDFEMAVATRRGRMPVETSSLASRAARAFFELGGRATKAALPEPVQGPPPTVFRETETGLLRMVYREIVIRFYSHTSDARRRAILADGGFEVRRVNPFVADQVVVYQPDRRYSGEELVEIANRWTQMDEVAFATPNFVSQYQRHVPPAILPAEWHLRNLGQGGALAGEDIAVRAAWERTTGTPDIVVAVLDDGVDLEHPNLAPNLWRNPDPADPDQFGLDFFLPPGDPGHFDPRPKRFRFPFDRLTGNDSHGTPCAGLIAAAGVAGGSVGVAPGCRVLPVKIFHADDLAPDESVADAIRYAAGRAAVLSCSWSGGLSTDIQQALEDAGTTPIFCAAGNGSGSPVGFPARDQNCIAVGASTDQAIRADYSNVGPQLSVVAPSSGGIRGIFSTDLSRINRGFDLQRDHTDSFGGTSAATPIAAGVAALMMSLHPGLGREEVRSILQETAEKIGQGYDARGHSNEFGFGRIDAGRAVDEAARLAGL
jgi:subtilisin family serine protease